MAKNLLIILSESGSGDAAKVDVFDALLFYDPDVEMIDTRHKDLYLLRTNLDPLRAHFLILKSLPKHISRVIPAEELCGPSLEEMKDVSLNLLKKRSARSFSVRARVRGSDLSPTFVEKEVGAFIKKMTGLMVDLEHPDLVIYIEAIDDLIAVAVLPGGFPISVKSLRQGIASRIDYLSQRFRSSEENEG